MKVLVVDDERNIVEIVSEEFRSRGHIAHTASNGREAIVALENENYDLVVSDFCMPEFDGLAVLKASKRLQPNALFFFLSGYSNISPAQCLIEGANNYFTKPISMRCMFEEIENDLARYRYIESAAEVYCTTLSEQITK